jgi:dolichyl-diphosphooligosaccharide--protein glycosyltransferase
MLVALSGQNRWTYYFAVNFAIIIGYLGATVLSSWKTKNIAISTVFLVLIIYLLAYPAFTISLNTAKYANDGAPSGGGFNEWYETLNWVKNNTPDPGLDYLAPSYQKPYPYPNSSYGIMSWWDYGHVITYYSHRIPTANPFQSGIGGPNVAGASTFLTAKSELSATSVLNNLSNVKYVISNSYMAYDIMGVFGVWAEDKTPYFTSIKSNNGEQIIPSEAYYQNMESRLHILDGIGLHQYRLIHESAPTTDNRELQFKSIYNNIYKGSIPIANSGLVKVFEVVQGAKIIGLTSPNTYLSITTPIITNINRSFIYTQTTRSNDMGIYSFTVPYAQTYTLLNTSINVTESDVQSGKVIQNL